MPYRRHLQDGSGAVEAAPPPPPPSHPNHHNIRAIPRRNHLFVPVVAAASALAVLAVIAAVLLCRWRRRRKRGSKTAPSSPHSSSRSPSASDLKKAYQIRQGKGGPLVPLQQHHHEQQQQKQPSPGPRRFTYDQLRRATAGFSPTNKLGQGGFGPVFQGALPLPVVPGGVLVEEVAVKHMDSGSLQGEIEFQNELSLAASMTRTAEGKVVEEEELTRLQLQVRKHVVLPLGFCSEDEPDDEWEVRRRQQRKKKKKKRRKKKKRPSWFDAADDDDEDSDSDSDRVAGGLDIEEGGEGVRKRVFLLVYELMPNGSLQDALLVRKCPELMSWPRRFAVAMDVARALKFLHTACDPPVVHGDIKPSNVLLDSQFNAKIADFGLARPLPPSAPSPEVASPSVGQGGGIAEVFKRKGDAVDLIGKDAGAVVIAIGGGDDNESTCTAAETESTFMACGRGAVAIDLGGRGSPEDDGCLSLPPPEGEEEPGSPDISPMRRLEVASACEVGGFDRLSVDSGTMDASGSRKGGGLPKKNASYGKDWWWWQQDGGVAATSKTTTSHVNDYVMEWIGSEVRKVPPNGTSNWAAGGGASNASGTAVGESSGTASVPSKKKQPRAAREWWAFLDEERQKKSGGWKKGSNGSHHHQNQRRLPREWWREEFCEELARKSKRKQQQVQANSPTIRSVLEEGQATPLHTGKQHRRRRSWSRGSRASSDWRGPDTPSGPIGRRPSHDWTVTASGDVPRSCAVSSTPSMRGTVCYAAPECGLSGEPPSEKCDIYSFGVLLLVIVSGRRPLQVTASPMSEFERANLISWARGLACRGKNLLDLLDPGLQGPVHRDQALLCVTVALLCLQRSPWRRPSIGEVVAMLSGETEPPHLPVEYSPSPQSSNNPYRSSRRKTGR